LYQDPHSFIAAIHPEDDHRVVEILERNPERDFEIEYRIVRPDGSIRWIRDRAFPIKDELGRFYRIAGIAEDITERKQAEEQLKATNEQLRALSARLQSAREAEGTRIAREIHDELGSTLTSVKWDLERTENILSDPKPGPELESMKKRAKTMTRLVESTIDIVRRISAELRPGVLDDLGLAPAVEWQARLFRNRTGIAVHCDCPQDDVDLNQEQSTAVFRIFQEALTNILRHSGATRVEVTMVEKGYAFVLTIRDNGRGITEGQKSGPSSIGLLGMRERAHLIGGEIEITGIKGEGTMVTVRLPLLVPGVHSETGN
jgi:signal transduction histidine kinase